ADADYSAVGKPCRLPRQTLGSGVRRVLAAGGSAFVVGACATDEGAIDPAVDPGREEPPALFVLHAPARVGEGLSLGKAGAVVGHELEAADVLGILVAVELG